MAEDMELLPPEMRVKSADEHEIVLPLEDALHAIEILKKKGHERIGWEGWVQHADGTIGCASPIIGTTDMFPADHCIETMRPAQAEWDQDVARRGQKLLFCLFI